MPMHNLGGGQQRPLQNWFGAQHPKFADGKQHCPDDVSQAVPVGHVAPNEQLDVDACCAPSAAVSCPATGGDISTTSNRAPASSFMQEALRSILAIQPTEALPWFQNRQEDLTPSSDCP